MLIQVTALYKVASCTTLKVLVASTNVVWAACHDEAEHKLLVSAARPSPYWVSDTSKQSPNRRLPKKQVQKDCL